MKGEGKTLFLLTLHYGQDRREAGIYSLWRVVGGECLGYGRMLLGTLYYISVQRNTIDWGSTIRPVLRS